MGTEVDSTITRVSFGYQIEFLFEDGSYGTIGGLGSVQSEEGEAVDFDAENPGPVADQLLGLLHTRTQVEVADGSTLRLRTANGTVVAVPPMGEFEAWELNTADGTKIVCAPGGELVRFGPPESQSHTPQ